MSADPRLTAAAIERLRQNPAAARLMASTLASRRFDMYAPFLVGIWLDTLFVGAILVLYARWVAHARRTDTWWTCALVHFTLAMTIFCSSCDTAHLVAILAAGFGDYLAFFDVLC